MSQTVWAGGFNETGEQGETEGKEEKAKQRRSALFKKKKKNLCWFQGKDLTAEFHIKAHF